MEIVHKTYEQDIIEKVSYESPFDVEKWYSSISSYTYLTEFLPLSIDEALVLRQKYKIQAQNCSDQSLSQDHQLIFDELQRKIQNFLNEKLKGKPVFVRLSTRSPKDTANYYEDPALFTKNVRFVESKLRERGVTQETLQKELKEGKKVLVELISESDMNFVVRQIINSGKDQLKV